MKQIINSKTLSKSFIFTFIMGLFAYGYGFLNFTPAHDGMMVIAADQGWQAVLGRIMIQYYVKIRGKVVAPWLIGILTLIFISVAVYLTVEMLNIGALPWKIFIVSAVYTLCISWVCTETVYIFFLDTSAMALALSVLAVYSFCRIKRRMIAIVVSAILLSLSMGLYQSYFATTVALLMLLFIKTLLDEENKVKNLLIIVAEELAMCILGAVLYFATFKLYQILTHTVLLDNYNSITNLSKLSLKSVLEAIPATYKVFFHFFFGSNVYMNRFFVYANIAILILSLAHYIYLLINTNGIVKKLFLVLVLILFPLGCNCIYVITSGMLYYVMMFSYQIFYLILLYPMLKIDNNDLRIVKACKFTTIVLIAGISLMVVRFSNDLLYYQKLVGEGTEASMTNILYDIERCPDFDKDTMKMVMVGDPSTALTQEYELRYDYGIYPGIGTGGTTVTYSSVFGTYVRDILGRNYSFYDAEELGMAIKETEEYKNMPQYPKAGWVKVIDGNLILNFGEQ